jgi:hypothetical protein
MGDMTMFKKGDKLLCIEGHRDLLLTGGVYTFDRYSSFYGRLYIEEGEEEEWYITRFIPATPLMEALW